MSKYKNKTNAAGIHITEASPIDDRLDLATEAEIALLNGVEPMPSIMYDGMVVTFSDTGRRYVWKESPVGLMAEGYTYPLWADDINGQNYAGKKYNFLIFDRTNKVTKKWVSSEDSGINIPKKDLPHHLILDPTSIIIMYKSSANSYTEQMFPSTVLINSTGIIVVMDPKPAVGTEFKILIM